MGPALDRAGMRSLLVLSFLAILAGPAFADPMSAGERQRLVAHLEMTEAWVVSELAGLSEAQLTWRPAPEAWSVKDVVEHLGIAEPRYLEATAGFAEGASHRLQA